MIQNVCHVNIVPFLDSSNLRSILRLNTEGYASFFFFNLWPPYEDIQSMPEKRLVRNGFRMPTPEYLVSLWKSCSSYIDGKIAYGSTEVSWLLGSENDQDTT